MSYVELLAASLLWGGGTLVLVFATCLGFLAASMAGVRPVYSLGGVLAVILIYLAFILAHIL